MKVALVHDWLINLGGAERVIFALHKIFPEAPVFTLFYDKKFVPRYLPEIQIIPSFLQKVPGIRKLHPWFKILMPFAAESFDFSNFDLVISSSHEFSHGILSKPKTRHLSYYHSPSRLLWDQAHDWLEDFEKRNDGLFKPFLIKAGQHFLRLWDYGAGQRPDIMIANSSHVAGRIKKYYGRKAKVVYPPVEITASESAHRTTLARLTNYFLIVSQLYPHKNIDLAIRAFKKIPKLNLLIIGRGPERKKLLKSARSFKNISFIGFVPDEELWGYYQNCLGYIICNEEDFGISPVEAMLSGKPVLAYKSGGAEETVLEGITGRFFYDLKPESVAMAVESFSKEISAGEFDVKKIRKHAEKFGFERFRKEILDIINAYLLLPHL